MKSEFLQSSLEKLKPNIVGVVVSLLALAALVLLVSVARKFGGQIRLPA